MVSAVWDLKSQFDTYKGRQVFDCFIAEALLSEGRGIPHLDSTLEKYKVADLKDLAEKQEEKLKELPKLRKMFYEIEMPLVAVLHAMEEMGITIDKKSLSATEEKIRASILELTEKILEEVGHEINLSSPAQVGQFLAEKGVPLAKTKTGQYATNENELQKHIEKFPIIQELLKYRELTKLLSTYTTTLAEKADDTGRIHTSYSQVSVNTGRLSSSGPNLQNIPVGSALGLQIKSCFVAAEGSTLLSFDYSQQELRILAHLSGEENLIEAFVKGRDVHTTTASKIFSVPYESVTKQQRSSAKTINFGIIYGMGSYGLSQGLHISVEEASEFIDNFYATFPKIKMYYDNYLKEGWKNDVAETLLGRRRYVKAYPQQKFMDNGTRRVLLNYPIQGTAAELMKMAMVKIHKEVIEKEKGTNLLLQIHDELVFETTIRDAKEMEALVGRIQHIMETIYPLTVPVVVEVKSGTKWGDMQNFTLTH